jgi:hypothetical protein
VPVTSEVLNEIDSPASRISVSRNTLTVRLLQDGLEAEQQKRDQRWVKDKMTHPTDVTVLWTETDASESPAVYGFRDGKNHSCPDAGLRSAGFEVER